MSVVSNFALWRSPKRLNWLQRFLPLLNLFLLIYLKKYFSFVLVPNNVTWKVFLIISGFYFVFKKYFCENKYIRIFFYLISFRRFNSTHIVNTSWYDKVLYRCCLKKPIRLLSYFRKWRYCQYRIDNFRFLLHVPQVLLSALKYITYILHLSVVFWEKTKHSNYALVFRKRINILHNKNKKINNFIRMSEL